MKRKIWLSVYIYYTPPYKEILTKSIYPFIQSLEKVQKRFFYIIYFSHGYHIRLRLQVQVKDKKLLKNMIQTNLETYLKQYPSEMNKEVRERARSEKWHKNNSIRFIAYHPELKRYGGSVGMSLAQEFFQASSIAAISSFEDMQAWNYSKVLTTALQINISMLYALGMSRDETIAFCKHKSISDESMLEQYEDIFAQQKTIIVSTVHQLWKNLETNQTFKEVWFNIWIANIKRLKKKLFQAYRHNLLTIPFKESHGRNQLWYLYESYMHMNNNRFNIFRPDEHLLNYIIIKSLESYE